MVWEGFVSSALLTTDANFEAFNDGTNAIVLDLTPGEIIDFNFSIAGTVGEVDDLEVQILGGSKVINGSALGTVTDASNFVLADAEADDYYMGMYFLMTTGGEVADVREISNYVNSTGVATVLRALSGTPTATETYDIYHMRPISQFIITAETTMTEDLPQNSGVQISGVPFAMARARATGATNAHVALMTYAKNAVSV